jgi:hypothetical protein
MLTSAGTAEAESWNFSSISITSHHSTKRPSEVTDA